MLEGTNESPPYHYTLLFSSKKVKYIIVYKVTYDPRSSIKPVEITLCPSWPISKSNSSGI